MGIHDGVLFCDGCGQALGDKANSFEGKDFCEACAQKAKAPRSWCMRCNRQVLAENIVEGPYHTRMCRDCAELMSRGLKVEAARRSRRVSADRNFDLLDLETPRSIVVGVVCAVIGGGVAIAGALAASGGHRVGGLVAVGIGVFLVLAAIPATLVGIWKELARIRQKLQA
jgi:hypothetical protein